MKLRFFILTMIFCSDEYSFNKGEFFIVTDRKLKGLVMKGGNPVDLLFLEDSTGCSGSEHFWDSLFPKPLMYKFSCTKLISLKTPMYLDLNGIASNDEILFKFTINYDLKNMIFSNFVDASNTSIADALFNDAENQNNIFILSREAKNVKNLKASYKYFIYTMNITPLYREILHTLFKYIINIEDFSENVNDFKEKIIQLNEVKRSLVVIFTTILQSNCSLRVLTFYNLSEIPRIEEFECLLKKVFESLEDIVGSYLKNTKGNDKNSIVTKTEIFDYIKEFIMQDESFFKCIEVYKKLFVDLKIIVDYVDDFVKRGKENSNLEILSDCNIAKVDEFIMKYMSLLLSYCRNIKDCNFNNFFTLYFARKSTEIGLSIRELEDLYIDKLIAEKLFYFINVYESNKTNILIFSQTDYFKNSLSSRIIKNLKLLFKVNTIYNVSKRIKERLSFEQMLIKLEYIWKILLDWKLILRNDDSDWIKSFDCLLKEESFPNVL